ncbi:solute carrier family 13 member 5-like isoform X2 [Rhinatrema bivittatum]|uniref:solute carrier family 13 member 5-like isoform X2 n=1 Tax=Rhinatrema bivittatum TaxID=194408 RepID=UPI00112DCAD5|nr:solute carrier family 13 member 5-like isoform X2 [Rhinatrema bivittatum]
MEQEEKTIDPPREERVNFPDTNPVEELRGRSRPRKPKPETKAPWVRKLLRFQRFLLLFLPPVLFMPLLVVLQTKEAKCGYVIIIMAVYWCTEVIPLAVTSLLPVLLLPLLGVMESKKVSVQYLTDTSMLFIGGLMVAIAVEHWNLHKRIALRVLLILGVKPALLMLGFMGVTAFLSMWISNTATTAMMIPIVQAVLKQLHASDLEVEQSEQRTAIGNRHILIDPKRLAEIAEKKLVNKGMTLCVCYAATIGGTATLTGTGANLVLKGQMNQLFPQNNDIVNFASWFGFSFPNMILMLFLAWFWLQYSFMGFNLQVLNFGGKKTEKEKAAYNVIKEEHRKLGPISFAEFNVLTLFTLLIILWLTREPGFVSGWASFLFNKEVEYVSDATVAMFIAVLLFLVPATKPRFRWHNGDSGETEEDKQFFPSPLLTWEVVQKQLPWGVVLLLGGGFALAKGSDASGLSKWMGNQMVLLQTIPPWAIVLILSLFIAAFTECTSNVTIATLFLPIIGAMAQSIKLHPLYVMLPCTLCTSIAFMLPVATPPNAIVFSYGHLRVSDMAKTGFVLNIIGVSCVSLAINTWGRVMFNLDTFPSWANVTSVL